MTDGPNEERPMGDNAMPDDLDPELRAALDGAIDETLAGAVPPASDDFWARVDGDLAAVAADRPPVRDDQPTGPVRAVPTLSENSVENTDDETDTAPGRDTDGRVVRLTDMNDPTTSRSPLLLRAAAVVAVVALGVAGLAFALRGDDTTTEAAGPDGGEVTTTSAPPAPTDTGGETTSTDPASSDTTLTDPATTDTASTDSTGQVTTTAPPPSTAAVVVPGCGGDCELSPITGQEVQDAGVDPIGWCFWSADGVDNDGDGYDDFYVFAGEQAVFVLDGTTYVLDGVPGTEEDGSWIVTEYEHPETGAIAERYELEFDDLGPIEETSIESIAQAATLEVTYDDPGADDGITIEIRGTLSCGV